MMDLSFSPRPQSLLSSPSSQFHLPSSIRRELLGFGPLLRPPSLRSRRRCRRPVTQNPPPRCAFHETHLEDSVVAVAAATLAAFAALQAIYLTFSRRRPGASQVSELRKDEAVSSQFLGDKSLETESFLNETSDISGGSVGCMLAEEVYPSDLKDAHPLKLQKEVMVHADDRMQPGYGFSSIGHGKLFSKTPAAEFLNSSSVMVHTVDMKQDNSSVCMPDLQPGECKEPVAVSSLPEVVIEHNVGSFSVPAKKIERKQTEDNEQKHATDESVELVFSGFDRLHRQFEEVTFYEEDKKPVVMSISCFESLNVEPPQLNHQNKIDSYARLRCSLKVSDALATGSHLSAEYLECQGPRASLKKGPKSQEKDLVKDNEIANMQKNLIHKDENGNLSGFTRQNGKPIKEDYDLLGYLRTYNRMLKDTRLKDCVGLLESMKRKGLLDMDKVHHTSFLKACKSKKAVREAFQFSKLIKKPTLSTYNSLLSVCAGSQDFDGAFQVMLLVEEAGLKPDCKLYTTLISTCAKCGKVDAMFEVFHEMVSAGVEPNVNTYGALIDGCARAGQVAKAFGAYGIMRSKKVQPDRVVFNALITACGQSQAVDRAFDVLAEMRGEARPIDPDHVTVGALMRTCAQVGQVDRVRQVYQMLNLYNIKGTPEVYTIAVRSCSQNGDLDFALSIYDDMKSNGVLPDEMFLSTIIDVAGHAGKIDVAFDILKDAKVKGIHLGHVSYSSLMGACCNAKQWKKALELYEDIKAIKLLPTIPMLNALITSLCDGDQLLKSVEVLDEMKAAGVRPIDVTYSILIVACERKGEAELGLVLLAQAKRNMILPNLIMCRCLTGLCLQSFEKACALGEPVVSFNSGRPQIDNKWTSDAIMVYRQTIAAGVIPTIEVFSQVLGCLKFPRDSSLRDIFIENLGVSFDSSKTSNISSLLDGFGEYDTRCFSIHEEAASLGVVPRVSIIDSPIFVDARKLNIHTVEVYLLTILKGLKYRLAAGARLPNITILLPIERAKIELPNGERAINLVGRVGLAVGSLLRRLGLPYQGHESYGKIRINGLTLRRWFKPKLTNSSSAAGRTMDMIPTPTRLAKGISDQQRSIRSNDLSLE